MGVVVGTTFVAGLIGRFLYKRSVKGRSGSAVEQTDSPNGTAESGVRASVVKFLRRPKGDDL